MDHDWVDFKYMRAWQKYKYHVCKNCGLQKATGVNDNKILYKGGNDTLCGSDTTFRENGISYLNCSEFLMKQVIE